MIKTLIKEYPYENNGKKYSDVFYSSLTIRFTYRNDNKEYFSDIYSSKTGDFLLTIPTSDVTTIPDKKNNTEYYIYKTGEKDEKVLNIMNASGKVIFTSESDMDFVLSSAYVVVLKNSNDNYMIYSKGDFKLISDIEYDTYEISNR